MNLSKFAEEIGKRVKAQLDPMNARLKVLEENAQRDQARIAELEKQAVEFMQREYLGVFQNELADRYVKGNMCTHRGSMWIAMKSGPGAPGEGSGWKLAVKRGADAREAR